MEALMKLKQTPKIFVSCRHPFDYVANMITLALPADWQTTIDLYKPDPEKLFKGNILNLIDQSTHFIAIWSRENRRNPLINQEIGAAIYKGIPLMILLERRMRLEAMLKDSEGTVYDANDPLEGIISLIDKLDQNLIMGGYDNIDRISALRKLNTAWQIYQHWL